MTLEMYCHSKTRYSLKTHVYYLSRYSFAIQWKSTYVENKVPLKSFIEFVGA